MSAQCVPDRILCVDDECRVLEGLEGILGFQYDYQSAGSAAEALALIESEPPFALVISDMRMPRMDGASFLEKVRALTPDTVRMLLTGYSDADAAANAVNRGNIFRFLSKPCSEQVLLEAVHDAVEQYRLVTAERSLLQDTLGGVIKVLTNVLNLAAPAAFARSNQLKSYVTQMATELGLADIWAYELAAMLSQLGCITLPTETMSKVYCGEHLSSNEDRMLRAAPEIAHELLSNVPRLEIVADVVRRQSADLPESLTLEPQTDAQRSDLGVALLQLALAADAGVRDGGGVSLVVAGLRKDGRFPAALLDALDGFETGTETMQVKVVGLSDLRPDMILDADVLSASGKLVLTKGRGIDRVLLERLRHFASGAGISEPIRVLVPSFSHSDPGDSGSGRMVQ